MIKVPFIEMYHPELGKEVKVQTEAQARLMEKNGWLRGKRPEFPVTDITPETPYGDSYFEGREDDDN